MPHSEHLCEHLNPIDDEREGTIVCTDCGLVLSDQLFVTHDPIKTDKIISIENENVKDILDKMNLPDCYTSHILQNCNEVKSLNKKLPYIVYKTLNENGCNISIKDVSNVSGVDHKKLYEMQEFDKIIIIEPKKLLEKYCKMLNLDFKIYSLIKEKLPETFQSGHSPLTIIATHIYKHSKDNNCKLSMKKIANVLQISHVSIQRYLKEIK